MKKISLLFFIPILLFPILGCDILGTSQLSPPGWIIGTWASTPNGKTYQFQFTSDNVIVEVVGDFTRDFKKTHLSISDSSSSTEYTINATELDGSSATYKFIKITAALVNCSISASWADIPLLPLIKQ